MKMDREICRALYQAEQALSPQLLHEMRNGAYSSLTRYHFTQGLWMRNQLRRADGYCIRSFADAAFPTRTICRLSCFLYCICI